MKLALSRGAYNDFCATLSHAFHVVQWHGADVWKVGGEVAGKHESKVFAIGAWNRGGNAGITFKVSDIAWELLRAAPGLRPAPYLASRGMKWLQLHGPGPSAEEIRQLLEDSHTLAARGLTKRAQHALGLV